MTGQEHYPGKVGRNDATSQPRTCHQSLQQRYHTSVNPYPRNHHLLEPMARWPYFQPSHVVPSGDLRLEFNLLFLRPPGPTEGDILIAVPRFQEWAPRAWEVTAQYPSVAGGLDYYQCQMLPIRTR